VAEGVELPIAVAAGPVRFEAGAAVEGVLHEGAQAGFAVEAEAEDEDFLEGAVDSAGPVLGAGQEEAEAGEAVADLLPAVEFAGRRGRLDLFEVVADDGLEPLPDDTAGGE